MDIRGGRGLVNGIACLASLLVLSGCAQRNPAVAPSPTDQPSASATAEAKATPSPIPTAATAWWCSVGANVGVPCLSHYAEASAAFAAIVPKLDMSAGNALYRPTQSANVTISLLMAGRAQEARAYLNRVDNGQLQAGDRLFLNGKIAEAMQWFVGSVELPNAEMKAAAKAIAAGDEDGAIAALERPSNDDDIYQEFDLEFNPGTKHLMLGDLYEDKHRWKDAFRAWAFAAEKGLPDAKGYNPVSYNFSGTEMIYYYRAHIPKS
jgi:hypothetical protein